jgi:GNAT superfamily N-acetyltransferase
MSTLALDIAEPGDVDLVADLVTDSFDHMPVIRNLVAEPRRRREVVRGWYRLYIEHAIAGAGQVLIARGGKGAAVWFDRTSEFSEPEDYAKRLAELAGPDLHRFQHLDELMDAHHPDAPHWHLLFLAVHPDSWRQGLGSALMNYTHRQLDSHGIPAYLEATNDRNAKLYRWHGYQDMTPPTIPVTDGIDLYRMWRPAQTP